MESPWSLSVLALQLENSPYSLPSSRGIGRVVAIASESNESQLKSLGATRVIDRHQSLGEIDKEVRAIVGDDLTIVYDCILGGQWRSNTRCKAPVEFKA